MNTPDTYGELEVTSGEWRWFYENIGNVMHFEGEDYLVALEDVEAVGPPGFQHRDIFAYDSYGRRWGFGFRND